MKRHYYSASIKNFRRTSANEILGEIVSNSEFAIEANDRSAWQEEIRILREALVDIEGTVYFEYSIPRMGKRIDVVVLSGPVIFVLEFKIGEKEFTSYALAQVWDYALDLKNFHETSRDYLIAPVLIATKAGSAAPIISATPHNDKVLSPIRCNEQGLTQVLEGVLGFADGALIDSVDWESGRYSPTPTIIEAAMRSITITQSLIFLVMMRRQLILV